MTCPRCHLSLRACRELHTLGSDKENIIQRLRHNLMPIINENDALGPQPSRANIGVSQISVPLAWNSDQHFKSKGETRVYSMFVVLQTKSRVVDSRMVTNVDRTMTDVVFPESFIFEGEPDDFCVEITLYAARTDLGLSDGGGSLRTRITRSLGRRFGGQVKSNLSTMEPPNGLRGDSAIGGTHFNMLARAYLVLTDAGDECKIHDLRLSAFVSETVSKTFLDINKGTQKTPAGNLHCFMNPDIHQNPSAEQTLLLVPITAMSRILITTHSNTLMLSSDNSPEVEGYDFYITAESHKTMLAWKKAIEMQIDDCAIWGEFAYRPTKLTFEKPADPVKETLSRAVGNRLYDKISIQGSVSRNSAILSPSLSYCPRELSPLKSAAQTAPTKRYKHRANVLELFEKPQPPPPPPPALEVSPPPLYWSSSGGDIHKCIIELDNNDGYGRIRSESSSSYMPRAKPEPPSYSTYMSTPSPREPDYAPNHYMVSCPPSVISSSL
ncbi:Anillin domain-containing protein [Trichostrongylus colubriformis]|uniref:Anillin domain-containing protein n=1 Tax=Trichostrongylus colubriformis TaxID=6319 RepID=A0AAN8J0M5_TRICO